MASVIQYVVFSIVAIMTSQYFSFSGQGFSYPKSFKSPTRKPTESTILKSSQQVHISLSGENHMRISWTTESAAPSTVYYGTISGHYTFSANGTTNTYDYLQYMSGQMHNAVIGPLEPNTLYYYRCGINSSRELSFKTPPARFPIKFAVIGDLGQTDWTKLTLQQIEKTNYDVLILPGDLSYANFYQPLWDDFGYLVEPLASKRPWMVTAGNHDVEQIKLIHPDKFTAYNARWIMPYEESGSPSNLFYSFQVGGVHVLMLGSYVDFDPDSDQYKWLQADLKKVNRTKTPWLVAVVHAPWYNSNDDHQLEYESLGMKETMESLLYGARVDVVFAGHVHAYERFVRVYKDKTNDCGPVYITAGAGGNLEGLATTFRYPQPNMSAFRQPCFGHGQFSVLNETHAVWTWHRNSDDIDVALDKVVLRSLASVPTCKL